MRTPKSILATGLVCVFAAAGSHSAAAQTAGASASTGSYVASSSRQEDLRSVLERKENDTSFVIIPIGRSQVLPDQERFLKRDPAGRLFSKQDLQVFKAWEKVDVLTVREQEYSYKGKGGALDAIADWTISGANTHILISLTEKGRRLNTSTDPRNAHIPLGSVRVTSVASDDELQKDFDRYRRLTGLLRIEWAEELKQVIRLLGKPVPLGEMKYRALFKFDKLAGGWKFITSDSAGANEEFTSDTVQKALNGQYIGETRVITAPEQAVTTAKPAIVPFRGNLTSVDKSAKTITVGQSTYLVTPETQLLKGGKPATLDDAVVGEEVFGQQKMTEDGEAVVIKVRFGPKPEAKAEGEPAPEKKKGKE